VFRGACHRFSRVRSHRIDHALPRCHNEVVVVSVQYVEYSVYPCFNLGPIYSPNRGRRQVSFPAHNGLRALLSERLTCRGSSCSDPGQPQHRCPVYHEMAEAFFQFMFDARSSSFRYTRGTGIGSHPISDKRAMGSWSLLCAVVLILPATLHR